MNVKSEKRERNRQKMISTALELTKSLMLNLYMYRTNGEFPFPCAIYGIDNNNSLSSSELLINNPLCPMSKLLSFLKNTLFLQ